MRDHTELISSKNVKGITAGAYLLIMYSQFLSCTSQSLDQELPCKKNICGNLKGQNGEIKVNYKYTQLISTIYLPCPHVFFIVL